MSSIVDIINHYQTSINKSLNDTARIVHCIGKLYKLPISVRHLQDTGIGRTVNSLRKYDGEVGVAAKALVTKWKAMVAAEESDDNTGNAGSHGEGADSDGRQTEDRQHRSDMSDQEEAEGHHHRTREPEDEDEDDEDDDDEDDDNNDRASHNEDQNESYEEPSLRVDEEYREDPEGNNSDSNGDESSDGHIAQPEVHHVFHHRAVEPDHELRSELKAASMQWNEHHNSSSSNNSSIKRHSSGSSSRNHHHSSSSSKSANGSGSGDKHKSHGSSSSSSSSSKRKSDSDHHHRHSSSGGESKSHKSSSSRVDHHGSAKKSSSHSDGERHKDRSSSKHHSSNNTSEHGGGGGGSSSIHNISISSSTSSNGSSHARKDSSHKESRHRSRDEPSGSSKRHASDEADVDGDSASSSSKRSRKEHRSDRGDITDGTMPSSSHTSTSSSSHAKKDKSKGHSSSSSSSKRREHQEKSESSLERVDESRSKSKRKDKSSSPSANSREPNNDDSAGEDGNGGLDCSGGASFADALAMIGMPSGSKKKPPGGGSKDKVKVSVTKPSSSSSSSSSSRTQEGQSASYGRSKQDPARPSSSSSSSSVGRNGGVPTASELLSQNVKLEPLPEASEIVESLPMISPHYRPMPLNQTVMECVFMGGPSGRGNKGRPLTEEEALGQSMQSKNMRTKVYSGMKTNSKGVIPTLYELCIRLLQDHIDEIGATGGIPFYILKPVLERANPTQLLHLEHFNPHFVEDSDVLWEQHCKRTFRSKQRNEEELETWREMFLRCSEERDAKLRSLTQNIKLSQEQAAAPIRKTQLAYVDSAVKPPRSVISKQVKYGTARAPVVSPAARVAALKAGNVAQAGDARLRVAAGVRDNAQAQVFQPTKPRKAPMMAKVLSSMKGFKTSFRR
uniref:TFIIS N-terminal domain-containing protein n=1 Tax=Anopheles coluzzii TaxID=1518534 RepID=A0A6E8VIV3_ANOCL